MGRPKNPENTLHKICPTCNIPFTCEKRTEKTYCCKICACNSPEVKKKNVDGMWATFNAKYGGHPMVVSKTTQDNFKTGMMLEHGVDHPSKIPGNYAKIKQIKLERYGDSNYNNQEQIKKTCLEKYGVNNMLKIYQPLGVNIIMDSAFNKVLSRCAAYNVTPLFTRDEYKGLNYDYKYRLKCNVCNHEYETPLTHRQSEIDRPICPKCNPNGKNVMESEIYKFLAELLPTELIKIDDRTVLVGKELDFYIPGKKLAIEHDGLYWHSEISSGRDPKYHLNKLKSCLFHGINLLHVFEDEWKSKSDIVKSIISSALGIYQFSINAYDCNIIELTHERASEFVENNHIQGKENASVRYGLEYNGEIVSAMTFGKDRFSKSGAWEMYRFCDKLNHIIPESSHRLFNHFVKTHKPEKIIAYSDRRYFTHEMYYTLGFHFAAHTHISYSYVSPDFKQRFNRMMFMKHRQKKLLAAFDPSKTEWENMQAHGFDRIWDCGSLKFVWKKPIAPHQANDLHHKP